MKRVFRAGLTIAVILFCSSMFSCHSQRPKQDSIPPAFRYERFKDSVMRTDSILPAETTNLFDKPSFNPGKDSIRPLLVKMDTLWRRQAQLMEHLDTLKRQLGQDPGFSPAELASIKANIQEVEQFLQQRDSASAGTCRGKDCLVFAQIDKSEQRLYLYVMGELKDTFKVSTGKGIKYETPTMNRHPAGPVLIKYMSRKFPGGNYKGLGNMPYAVFVSGGYAIHGTTPGNFSKLGNKASHGCIRLHPDNAKIFNALVRSVGLSNTWVEIKE